ncbi:MAG: hypothetical protein U0136_21725 [Bdellovibrionota bacterium]
MPRYRSKLITALTLITLLLSPRMARAEDTLEAICAVSWIKSLDSLSFDGMQSFFVNKTYHLAPYSPIDGFSFLGAPLQFPGALLYEPPYAFDAELGDGAYHLLLGLTGLVTKRQVGTETRWGLCTVASQLYMTETQPGITFTRLINESNFGASNTDSNQQTSCEIISVRSGEGVSVSSVYNPVPSRGFVSSSCSLRFYSTSRARPLKSRFVR